MDRGEDRGSRWTLVVLPDGASRSRTLRFSGRLAVAAGVGAALVMAAVGAALGVAWSERAESREVAELREEVRVLSQQRAEVDELSRALDEVEERYRRLWRAVAGDGAEAREGAVALPPGPEAERRAGEDGREGDTRAEGSGSYVWPLAESGFVTRTFGEGTGDGRHPGLDVAVPRGSYVRAIRDGVVTEAGEDPVYGYFARILHPDGLSSLYAHADWLFVEVGDSVETREVIALSGNTGQSTAPHLHFELRRDGNPVDPAEVLQTPRR